MLGLKTQPTGLLARFAECKVETCIAEPYTVVSQPRTFGIRFSQDF